MADRKISALAALTAPASNDYLPIIDISEPADVNKSKRITIEELLRGAPSGTGGAPGIAFEGDDNTGIYNPSGDQLAISTGGSERLRIDSSGRVGIGTSSPVSKLSVTDTMAITALAGTQSLLMGNQNFTGASGPCVISSGGRNLLFGVGDSWAAANGGTLTEYVRISDIGRVGIGTGSPDYLLHVNNSSSVDTELAVQNGAGLTRYGTRSSGNAFAGSFTAGKDFELWSANVERLRIDSSGRVGIGTSSPSTLLDVNSDTVRVRTARTPASAAATGAVGEVCWDASYIYVCTATNTWKRAAISTW